MSDESVELADAIDLVRRELIEAQRRGRRTGTADALTFEVGRVTVEFAGEVSRTVGGGGGLKFWVVNAEAKAERGSGSSQRVTVELIPHGPDGAGYAVSDGIDTPPPG